MTTPFVDYYRENGISPVSQDIEDLRRHFERRESLYLTLGTVPRWLRGRRVIELCAGSGYNALYTQSLQPKQYTLVDGNPFGIDQAKKLFARYFADAENVEFHLSLIDDFIPAERYDLVICEGAIPFQRDPKAFARGLCRFAEPGALMILTCIDAVSFLSEITRRLLADVLVDPALPVRERLELLRPVFAPHLATLVNASRPIDDWILDNIINPFEGTTFSIADAIDALDDEGFVFHAASPRFTPADWRWYKDLVDGNRLWNERARDAYLCGMLSLLDCRYARRPQTAQFGRELLAHCQTIYQAAQLFRLGEESGFVRAVSELEALTSHVRFAAPETAGALDECLSLLAEADAGAAARAVGYGEFFGRGQQHVSFIAPA